MTLVVGIDGGGTKTRIVLLDTEGQVHGVGESGPGNLHDMGPERTRDHVLEAWTRAWEQAGRAPRPCDAGFFGMASVVTQDDRDTIHRIGCELELAPPQHLGVDVDLRIALAGGLAGKNGIVVIAGTGSSCFGRSADGVTHMASGWGSTLDDRGSAHDLGMNALVACVFAADGRAPHTSLMTAIRKHMQLGDDWRQLMTRIDVEGMTRSEVAGLAHLVTDEARAGDRTAREIIESATFELSRAVEAVADALEDFAPTVVAVGGLAQSGPEWRLPFERAVQTRLPESRMVEPLLPPALGACLVAFESLGMELEPKVLKGLIESHQPELSAWRQAHHELALARDADGGSQDDLYIGFEELAERCRIAQRIRIDGTPSAFFADYATGLSSALKRVGRETQVIDATTTRRYTGPPASKLSEHFEMVVESTPETTADIEIIHGPGSFLTSGGDLHIWVEIPEREIEARRGTAVLCELNAMDIPADQVEVHRQAHLDRIDLVCDAQRPGLPLAVEREQLAPSGDAVRSVGGWLVELEGWMGGG
jgi:glucosamine kinase